MSLIRLMALIRKEIRHIYRDPQIFFMAIVAPAFILFLLSYVFSLDAGQTRIGVMDLDRSAAARQVIRDLTATDDLVLVQECTDYDQAAQLLRRGQVSAVLVIPHGFGDDVAAGRSVAVQALLDGSNESGSTATYSDLAVRMQQIGVTLLADPAGMQVAPLTLQSRILYNPTGKSVYAMVPGLMAAAFCFPAVAVAMACTRETERGSYESLLSTPMARVEYILGKLIPYMGAAMLSAVLTLLLALLWFKVPLRGSLGAYFATTFTFLLAILGVSVTVGAISTSQRHTIIIVILMFYIPTFFMSGLLTPLDAGRPLSAIIKLIMPAANYVVANRAVFLKGVGLADLWVELGNMLRIFAISFIASFALVRRKVV